jgi:hypothetical protein
MASEQTGRMNRSIDSRSDLYSLGSQTLGLTKDKDGNRSVNNSLTTNMGSEISWPRNIVGPARPKFLVIRVAVRG